MNINFMRSSGKEKIALYLKQEIVLLFILLHAAIVSAQSPHCIDERYGEIAIFDSSEIIINQNVNFANATHYFTGQNTSLDMDIYMPDPAVDPIENRPFILMIHGGGFLGGTRSELAYECFSLAQRGFVTATIDYRVGWNCDNVICVNCYGTNMQKAIYCAVQDARAAMRFVHTNRSDYGIDDNWMFMGGESAGSITALLSATWDQNEVDSWAPPGFSAEVGSLNSSGNNLPNEYQVRGNVNHCGAVVNLSHLDNNTDYPIVSFHDSNDCVVPYGYGPVIACFCSGFLGVYGSSSIHSYQLEHGRCSELHTVPQILPNHCQFPKYNLVNLASCFMKRLMCGYCLSFENSDIYARALCANQGAPQIIPGCTYENASNYNSSAQEDDGSCMFSNSCLADLNADNIIGVEDLMILIGAYGQSCGN